MRSEDLIDRLQSGHKLHMQIIDSRRVWWLEEPHANVAEETVLAVLYRGQVKESGDSLFGLPMNSQTWEGTL